MAVALVARRVAIVRRIAIPVATDAVPPGKHVAIARPIVQPDAVMVAALYQKRVRDVRETVRTFHVAATGSAKRERIPATVHKIALVIPAAGTVRVTCWKTSAIARKIVR